jgi:hypothetical protein
VARRAAHSPVAVPETMRKANGIFGKDGYIRPGAIIYYDQGEQVPRAINTGANYPITLEVTERQASNIKDWFYVDFFLMLRQQGSLSRMTATTVQALQGEKAAVMTHMIVNLKKALQVVVQRTFDVMGAQGRLPELPDAPRKPSGEGGNAVKFTFASVLSQIQQAALRFQGTRRFLPVAQAVALPGGAYPPALEALDRFDFDEILRNEARAANLPETAIKEDDDVDAVREARARAAEEQRRAAERQQAQQTLAQNYGRLNEPSKPGSPAAAIAGEGAA